MLFNRLEFFDVIGGYLCSRKIRCGSFTEDLGRNHADLREDPDREDYHPGGGAQ